MKIRGTPFEPTHRIPEADLPSIPFMTDFDTIRRLKRDAARPYSFRRGY